MTASPCVPLLRRCIDAYFQEAFSELTLRHPWRMAAVFSLLCAELSPEHLHYELMAEIDATVRQFAPKRNNPCDPKEQQLRQDFLEWLYDCSGRLEAGNHTYTGLYQEFLAAEAAKKEQLQ